MTNLLDAAAEQASGTTAGAATGSPFAAPTGPPVAPATPVAAPVAGPSGAASNSPAAQHMVPDVSGALPAMSADPAMNPLHGAAPQLPVVPTHQPRQDQARPLPGTLPVDYAALQPQAARQPLVRWGHVFKTVFWLTVLAGLSAAGVLYGPELYERHFGDPAPELAGATPIADEPPAPLAFPPAAATPPIAAATFELTNSTDEGDVTYIVTTDFASGVAQTTVRRDGEADLDVITFGDQALIRRVDEPIWYRAPRGQFPVDGQLARQHWVRLVDEVFPADVRAVSTIEGASTSSIAGIPTRRLAVTVPNDRLTPPPSVPSLRPPAVEAAATAAQAAPVPGAAPTIDPATGQPVTPVAPAPVVDVATGQPVDATQVAPNAAQLPPPAPGPWTSSTTTVEVWVDGSGIIRQAIGSEMFGVERITVSAAMAQPWAPILPPDELIAPLDAQAVVHLGL